MNLTIFRIYFVAPFEVRLHLCGFMTVSFKNQVRVHGLLLLGFETWLAQTVFHEYFIETRGPDQVGAGSVTLQTKMKFEHKNEVLNGV